MKKTLIQLFILVAFLSSAYSQKYNGYVITESDSLIKGNMILQNVNEGRGRKIILTCTKSIMEKPLIFYTLEVKEYAFKKDTFKILTNVHLMTSFSGGDVPTQTEAKVIVTGRLNLYLVKVQKGITYVSTGYGSSSVAAPNVVSVYIIEDQEGFMVEVNNEEFVNVMKDVLKGAPVLSARIEKKELKYKHLKSIIREYNGMIITRPKKKESSGF